MPMIELNGANCFYERRGQGKNTLIFLHGLFFDGSMFAKTIEMLETEFTCITLDWRSQGRSEATDFGLDADGLVYDLKQFIDKLGIEHCSLIGVSVGGVIALRFAAQFPKLVQSIVGIGSNAKSETIDTLSHYESIMKIYAENGAKSAIDSLSKLIFGPDFNLNSQMNEAREFWCKYICNNDHVSVAKAAEPILRRRDVTSLLNRIECPALMIVGEYDYVNDISKSLHIVSQLKNGNMIVMKNVGHTPPVEAPVALATILKGFFS